MDTLHQQIAEQARLVRESSKMRSTSAKKEHPALVREHKRLQVISVQCDTTTNS